MSLDPVRDVVQQLAVRRKRLGYSQIDVDRLIGCANGLSAKWECGKRTPSLGSLVNYAAALEGYLVITGTPIPKPLISTEQVLFDIQKSGCTVQVVDCLTHSENKILAEMIAIRAFIKKTFEME